MELLFESNEEIKKYFNFILRSFAMKMIKHIQALMLIFLKKWRNVFYSLRFLYSSQINLSSQLGS